MARSGRSQTRPSGEPKASPALSQRVIAQGVAALCALDDSRRAKRARFSSVLEDDDGDADSPAPIYLNFLDAQGSEGILNMTNFSPTELDMLWDDVKDYITHNWNVGSGRKCAVSGRDLFFMTLTALKHCGTWDIVAATFQTKAPTFERRVVDMLTVLHPFLLRRYVDAAADKWTMRHLLRTGNQFKNLPFVRYATDVTFQHTQKPQGSFAAVKAYFSAKHNLYGHKVEVSVLPNGLAIGCSSYFKRATSDIEILKANRAFHMRHLAKMPAEQEMADGGVLHDTYPNQWAVVADKGYQGARSDPGIRCITPLKTPPGGSLSLEERQTNAAISSDRVIVENFFGRMKSLWAVCSDIYRWKRDFYDVAFQCCMALTNVHVRLHPLRAEDANEHARYVNRLIEIGASIKQKEREAAAKYRRKRKARVKHILIAGPAVEDRGACLDSESECQSAFFSQSDW